MTHPLHFYLLHGIMKESKYNYIIPYKLGHLLFNGISKQFIELTPSEKEYILTFFRDIKTYCALEEFKVIVTKFHTAGFIVNDTIDEFSEIKKRSIVSIERKRLSLTIFPTYKCNFSCWYCIQNHSEEFMRTETMELLKKFLSQYSSDNNIEEIEISWFGGEPLLCFDTHIHLFCSFVKDFAKQHNIKYFNSITTNGFLFTPSIVNSMKKYNFKVFQITIDGDKEHHNQTRNANKEPSFDTILGNIVLIVKNIPKALLCLRFNYTHQNLTYYKQMLRDINNKIPFEYRKKVHFFPRQVWQESKNITAEEIQTISDEFIKNGYSIFEYDIPKEYLTCEADRKHRFVIFQNGKVDKCENIPPDKAAYIITPSGQLKKEQISLPVENSSFHIEKPCEACNYLPICLGPCKLALRDCEKYGFKCVKTYNGFSFNTQIIYYYENIVKRNML